MEREYIMCEKEMVKDVVIPQDTLVQKIVDNLTKKQDELIYSLFEEYGYHKDDVIPLMKKGIIAGERHVYQTLPTLEVTYFYVDGELLFAVNVTFDSITYTGSVNYKKFKEVENV